MKTKYILRVITAVAAAALLTSAARAGNIDLATLPARDSVQLTIYNSEDITLVRETRSLSLMKGINRIQYSWANTLIDPTSVEIRPLDSVDAIDVLDTTYPGDKPQQLVWNIQSEVEGQVRFQVTYFTSGLTWSADYVLIADADETKLSFDGNVVIVNNSGEDYQNAQVRLVVGVINLVEKIRDLASRGLSPAVDKLDRQELEQARQKVYIGAVASAESMMDSASAPAAIVKEGLSEYFIYTIEGSQDIPDRSSKRLSSFKAADVSFDIVYRLRPHQYGPRPVRFFMLKNDEEHKLGETPLPDGSVRTFRDNGRDGLCFLGRQQIKYVPIKEDIELNVGTDDDVLEEHTCLVVSRSNFSFDQRQNVNGYDEARSWREEIRNYRSKPITIEIRRVVPGDVAMQAEGATLFDYHTVEFKFTVKPAEKLSQEYKYVVRQGKNDRQNRIALTANLK